MEHLQRLKRRVSVAYDELVDAVDELRRAEQLIGGNASGVEADARGSSSERRGREERDLDEGSVDGVFGEEPRQEPEGEHRFDPHQRAKALTQKALQTQRTVVVKRRRRRR